MPRRSSEVWALTVEQAKKLLEVARGHRLEVILAFALATGMRRGEIIGLQWKDISWQDSSLQVRRTVNRYVGHGFQISEPKTAKSRRKIVLPTFVLELLKEHQARQLEARLRAGSDWEDHDLVFCNIDGRYINPSHLGVDFQRLLKKANLPLIRFHDLRLTAASLLFSMGVNPKVVQELLGHGGIQQTLDVYSHTLPGIQEDAMRKMDHLFKSLRD